jgi:hypothetical protein
MDIAQFEKLMFIVLFLITLQVTLVAKRLSATTFGGIACGGRGMGIGGTCKS